MNWKRLLAGGVKVWLWVFGFLILVVLLFSQQ